MIRKMVDLESLHFIDQLNEKAAIQVRLYIFVSEDRRRVVAITVKINIATLGSYMKCD